MTTQQALEVVGISVDGVSREALVAIVRRLQAENERLRKDADRLDWLLSDFGMHHSAVFRAWDGWSDLRPVIDAARGGK